MVSSFDPLNMCAKVERITAKTGCTSCTNWTISFKVQGFHTKTHLLQRHFIFISLFQLKTVFASNMQNSKPHTEISCTKFKATYTKTYPLQRHFIFLSL